MKIIKKSDKLIISTYPMIYAIFCGGIILIALYSMVFKSSPDLFGCFLGIIIPLVFLSLFKKIESTFDRQKGNLVINTNNFLKKENKIIKLENIIDVKICTGRGKYTHKGTVNVKSNDGESYPVSAMGSLNNKKQSQVKKEIKKFLNFKQG